MGHIKELLRTFSAAKTVDSHLLNRAGVQPARAVAARSLSMLRPLRPHASVADRILELRREGYVEIPEFLPAEIFGRVRQEALEALSSDADRSVHDHGGSALEQVLIHELDPVAFPATTSFLDDPRLRQLFRAAERRNVKLDRAHASVERLTVHDPDKPDRESALHVDTFFDTFKCWLYLDDVAEDSSPFVYVPRSQQLSRTRLRRIYRESIGPNWGSRRISAEELAESGLSERTFHCKANTFVMANTFGFHRRKPGVVGSTRLALHVSVRHNPFLPEALNRLILRTRTLASGPGSSAASSTN